MFTMIAELASPQKNLITEHRRQESNALNLKDKHCSRPIKATAEEAGQLLAHGLPPEVVHDLLGISEGTFNRLKAL